MKSFLISSLADIPACDQTKHRYNAWWKTPDNLTSITLLFIEEKTMEMNTSDQQKQLPQLQARRRHILSVCSKHVALLCIGGKSILM